MCSPRPFRWFFGSSGPPVPDPTAAHDREEALTLYRIAVDEYRFQVTLNWNRTQYTLALNIGVLGVGVGVSGVAEASPWMVTSIFAVGAACCLVALVLGNVQHGYYRAARDRVVALGAKLELGEAALATTPGLGSRRRRIGRVTTFVSLVLLLVLALDVLGAVLVL